jgi:hypothetical protein
MKATLNEAVAVEVKDFSALVSLLDGNKAARFVGLTYRAKETGELARHTILLNAKRNSMLKHDVATLTALRPSLTGLDLQACDELIASMNKSLNGTQDAYTKAGYYDGQGNGNVQVSVKAVAYVRGYSVGKTVLEKGTYKTVNSRPLTIAKDKLRKGLKNTRCREFIIKAENFVMARHDGRTILIDATGNAPSALSALVGKTVNLAENTSAPVPA